MLARQYADRVVSSVFVNPTQFGPNEDYTRYPRTPDADTTGLEGAGCDVLWLPTVESMYPFGIELAAKVHVPGVSGVLEGECRPGHFDGVCTVVSRLFNQVTPDLAAFGKKDYQQLAVIRQMVTDLAFPVEILGGSIVREADGLAMSSRNQYLSDKQRPVAAEIRRTLLQMRDDLAAGALFEAQRRGLRVPQDLALMGFNDAPIAAAVVPALSSVAVDRRGMGHTVATLLLERLAGATPQARVIDTGFSIVARASTDAPPRPTGDLT